MTVANPLSLSNVEPESVTGAGERHRRWLRRGFWGGSLFFVVSLLAVVSYPSMIRWRLESRGWEIEYAYRKFTEPPPWWLPRFMEPWLSDCAAAHLHDSPVIADDARLLFALPRIIRLDVHGVTISEPAFKAIGQLQDLRFLDIRYSKLDEQGMHQLAQSPRLESIYLHRVTLNAEHVKGISSCHQLRTLRLAFVEVADEDLVHLSRSPQLRTCWFDLSEIGDQGLGHVAKISSLRSLIVVSKNVTDVGILHLSQLHEIEELDLQGCQATDQGVKKIVASCRRLKKIRLDCPLVTDAVLTEFAGLPSLERLVLYRAPISASQLRAVRHAPALRFLNLAQEQLDAIRPEDWDELKRAKPNLEITFNYFNW